VKFAIDDDSDVAAVFEELHDFGAFAGEDGPPGVGIGVLFQCTDLAAFETEVNLFQVLLSSCTDWECLTAGGDRTGVLDESLIKYAV